MTNKEQLICLFESEGFDVSSFYLEKANALFRNKSREEIMQGLDESLVEKILALKVDSYLALCLLENKVEDTPMVDLEWPTNPFLFDYHKDSLGNQCVNSCLFKINGETFSLEYIKKMKISGEKKKEKMLELKRSWHLDIKSFLNMERDRKLIDLGLSKDCFRASKDVSIVALVIKSILLFVFTCLFVSNLFKNDMHDTQLCLWIMVCLIINITMNSLLISVSYNNLRRRINNEYDRLIKQSENICSFQDKVLFSKARLNTITNYKKLSDAVGRKYLGGKKSRAYKKKSDYQKVSIATYVVLVILILWFL